ncbi:MAG TPA: hypothetical protein VN622_03145 [Clostridia bacterium]|nr:hypothetical protein [Clostridia bacterium]
MQRPTGVTVLAILHFISAAFLLLISGGLLLGGGMVGAVLGGTAAGEHSMAGGLGLGLLLGGLGSAVFFVLAGISAVLGWGLFSLMNWARIISIVFAAIGAVSNAARLLVSLIHFHIFGVLWSVVMFGIDALIIWYLVQPHVKAAFEQRTQRTIIAS